MLGMVTIIALTGCVATMMHNLTDVITEETSVIVAEHEIVNEIDYAEESAVFPEIMHLSGTISARGLLHQLNDDWTEDTFSVLVEGEADEDGYIPIVHFIIDRNTVLLLNVELELGVAVKVFYEADKYMVRLNHPVQHARVLVSDPMSLDPNAPFQNDVIVSRFDENWMAQNHPYSLQLAIGEDTQIVFQDGQLFVGEVEDLINLALVAWGGMRTRVVPGYPNIAAPDNIIILFDMGGQPMPNRTDDDILSAVGVIRPDTSWQGGLPLTQEDLDIMWDNMLAPDVQVFVNGEAVEMPTPFVNREAGSVMVPIVYIAEALGLKVHDNGENTTIELEQAFFIIREDSINLTGVEPVHELHDGVLFIPLDLFGGVLPPAYIMDGHVFINDSHN